MTRRPNEMIDQTIGNVFAIQEAPTYLLRQQEQQQQTADAAEEQQELQRFEARETLRRRMAQRGLSVIDGNKHL